MTSREEDTSEAERQSVGAGLCDVHNHLLPRIDDGSRSLAETLLHLRRFRAEGVTHLVFTPHLLAATLDAADVDAELARQRERFDEVRAGIGDGARMPRLFLGQEIYAPVPTDLDHVIGRYDVGFGGGETLLVELGFSPGFDGDAVVARVIAEGRRIVIAHPERYQYGSADPLVEAARWREMGAVLQVNGGSIAGLYTEQATRLAHMLLHEGLVDIVSSDHHGDFRAHAPALSAKALASAGFADAVQALMGSGPRATLPSVTAVLG